MGEYGCDGELVKVLVTGGAGYIGSTICSVLEDYGHVPIVLDSLVKGQREFVRDRIFYEIDIADVEDIGVCSDHPDIDAIIHCAAFANVAESCQHPELYYDNNVSKSIDFLRYWCQWNCPIIYSSSTSVYGSAHRFVKETDSIENTRYLNPYSKSKLIFEQILEDYCYRFEFLGISLRYSNPIGADPKMRSGPYNEEDRLLDNLVASYFGDKQIDIFGSNWPTVDGTALRDYVHVLDVAIAHVAVLEGLSRLRKGFHIFNVGSGQGHTVKQVIDTFNQLMPEQISYRFVERRPGDFTGSCAKVDKIRDIFGWSAEATLEQCIMDHLIWKGTRIPDYKGILKEMAL